MHSSILSIFNHDGLFYKQISFCERQGTDTVFIVLIGKTLSDLHEGNCALRTLFGVSKAFDTVGNKRRLMKFYDYGIWRVAYDWIKRYFQKIPQSVIQHIWFQHRGHQVGNSPVFHTGTIAIPHIF